MGRVELKMLYVSFTYDYELFFGENYYPSEKVLFEPTEKIIDISKRLDIGATFFIDTQSVLKHIEYNLSSFSKGVENQIQKMLNQKQDVQFHLHPHWLTSKWINGKWSFSYDVYRLHDIEKVTSYTLNDIIKKNVDWLNKTCRVTNPTYQCCAFRAGGYCLQPYDELIHILNQNGIYIDSSVSMYQSNRGSTIHQYNYMKLPQSANFYLESGISLSDLPDFQTDSESLFEVPIGYYKGNYLDLVRYGKKGGRIRKDKPLGSGINDLTILQTNKIMKILQYPHSYMQLSVDSLGAEVIHSALIRFSRMYNTKNKDAYIAIIGHPKTFTGDAFVNLEKTIELIQQEKDFKILTIAEISKRINGGVL